jgi:hypothetical protein
MKAQRACHEQVPLGERGLTLEYASPDNALMDYIRFRRRHPDDYPPEVVDIVVNERALTEFIKDIEGSFAEAEGSPWIAGNYVGLGPEQLDGSPTNHFFGSSNSHLFCGPEDKTVLLICRQCGEPGCWPLMARVEVTTATVTWTDFEQPHRSDAWRYDGLSLTFDRCQYESALAEIER